MTKRAWILAVLLAIELGVLGACVMQQPEGPPPPKKAGPSMVETIIHQHWDATSPW